MNSSRSAHEVSGLPHCLVDGFKHRMPEVPYADRCYILTHYHSDHYGGLTSFWKHGRIYCSTTTANLICNVLMVNPTLVTRVAIGDTITIKGAQVTFMDANHCPGAVILLFNLDSGLYHLHTGDLRYCPAMKLYPALQNVKIDKVYLDTTYAHPKHTFMTQEESIVKIVGLAREFIAAHPDDGIVFMSAYNLGKERVIFALADALQLPVYMDSDKIHIMNQIPGGAERVQAGVFTTNPRVGRIHICQMGFLGTLFPFFKPNFAGIKQHIDDLNRYRQEAGNLQHFLDTPHCPMPRILAGAAYGMSALDAATNTSSSVKSEPRNTVYEITHHTQRTTDVHNTTLPGFPPTPIRAAMAFIPTGWAENSNFNKTHNCLSEGEITVCTVPYSEHSNCPELVEFVRFLKPREVVPTVYSDEKNRLAILELFRNCVDRTSNLRSFLAKFGPTHAAPANTSSSSSSTSTAATSSIASSNTTAVGTACVGADGRDHGAASGLGECAVDRSPRNGQGNLEGGAGDCSVNLAGSGARERNFIDLCDSDNDGEGSVHCVGAVSDGGETGRRPGDDRPGAKRVKLAPTGTVTASSSANSSTTWSCTACTYRHIVHSGSRVAVKEVTVRCDMCGTPRSDL